MGLFRRTIAENLRSQVGGGEKTSHYATTYIIDYQVPLV